ncbi:heparinase II/III family protein [Streptomyces sp. NPDC057565]|uniref:heparinase II/III family protein n=1 Tax=Streptomyces sp. NPDC057565 TaxID=3346169 RepID=UPI003685E427
MTSPRSARLSLTGRTSGSQQQQVTLYQVQVAFDETTRCWNNTVQNTFSWQGNEKGFDWKSITSAHVDNEFYYQLPRFYFAGPLADAHRDQNDKKIATGLIGLMTDFIDDTTSYGSTAGAASYPRNLDAAWRFQNWCYAYEILRTSPSLTADANTAILKAFYAAGPFFATTTSVIPNRMVTIKSALIYLGVCFPEFAAASQWRDHAQTYLVQQLAAVLYADGGYTEASSTTPWGSRPPSSALRTYWSPMATRSARSPPLSKLSWFLADQLYLNGYDPAFGDSSYTSQRGDGLHGLPPGAEIAGGCLTRILVHATADRTRGPPGLPAAIRGGRGRGRPCRAVPRAPRPWSARRARTWRPRRTGP